MSLPDDKNPMPVNKDIGDGKNYSEAPKSSISSPDEDKSKEERIARIIDDIVTEKIKPINAQLEQMPQLIKDTVVMVFNEISASQQKPLDKAQPVQPQDATAAPNMNNLAALVGTLAPLIKGSTEPAADPMLDMIKGAFSKMIQAKVDETIMGTYGVRMPPPPGLTQPVKTNKNSSDLVE